MATPLEVQEFLEEITQDFKEDSEHVFKTNSTNKFFCLVCLFTIGFLFGRTPQLRRGLLDFNACLVSDRFDKKRRPSS